MPAMITHALFAQRVFARLKKEQTGSSSDPMLPRACDAARIGAQGPDVFFFHRVLPWQPGVSLAPQGQRLHKISPSRLFEGFRTVLNTHASDRDTYAVMESYIEGFFCHYALDRAAHPFVYYWQKILADEQPRYGTKPVQYHFRIESALDTMTLRRDTGRLIRDFKLPGVLPAGKPEELLPIGQLYQGLFGLLPGFPRMDAVRIALAPADMRQAMSLMTDRTLMRQRLLHPLERMTGQGHIGTSLMRPDRTEDWDYANEEHREWCNPFDTAYKSRDSFFDLYDLAVVEAADMIRAFRSALPEGRSMREITQDRGFASDLPGIYDIQ